MHQDDQEQSLSYLVAWRLRGILEEIVLTDQVTEKLSWFQREHCGDGRCSLVRPVTEVGPNPTSRDTPHVLNAEPETEAGLSTCHFAAHSDSQQFQRARDLLAALPNRVS